MKILLAAFVGALLCLPISCATAPNWPRVAIEMDLAAADLTDVASMISDENLAQDIEKFAALLGQVADAIEDGSDTAGLIDRALTLADVLIASLPDDKQQDARAVLMIARVGLRRVAAYAEVPQ